MIKVKPKEILVDLPAVIPFNNAEEIHAFIAPINSIIHGKVKIKYDELGWLGEQYMCIVYLQRNLEYQELYDEFIKLIEHEEKQNY